MKLATEVFGEVVVTHAPEEIGEDRASDLLECLTSLCKSQVVLDIDGAETIDSAGLATLLDAQDALRREGGDLKVASTNAVNRKIFEITRLDQQLEVFDSVLDAVKSFM
jgi:anti-sigma B factor antagonist